MAEDELGIETDVLDLDQIAEGEQASWPSALEQTFQQLRQVKGDRVVNARNLGDLAFTNADRQLGDVVKILADLRLEEWRLIPEDLANQIVGNANALLETMREMAALRSSHDNAQAERNRLQERFDTIYRFLVDDVRPVCVTARVVDVLQTRRDLLPGDVSQERLDELQATFQKLEGDAEEFKSLSDLVSAQRQLVGKEGVTDLSHHFAALGTKSKLDFDRWAKRLAGAVAIGGVAAMAFVYLTRPANDAGNAEIVTHVIIDVLAVGLIIFLIRFFALQARAHRHVEFVARNKANALSTFNLIVAGQEDEAVRSQIASALAQAVFKSDDGIFSDASSDTVTIIERVIGAASARAQQT